MIEKDEFLLKYKITQDKFKAADISWELLVRIYEDYNIKKEKYEALGKELSSDSKEKSLFYDPKQIGLHSFYWRVKEPEHLIAKIIRKRCEHYNKYRNIDVSNYWMIVRDLLGFRGLLVFREDWPMVHEYILSKYKDDPKLYICDSDLSTFNKEQSCYLAEPTRAHVRDGDDISIYNGYLRSDNIINKQNHRSVHYIIKYEDVCVELQIRTLFEEALGEMDHKVRYPINISDGRLTLFAGIMNHLVGAVDELGSFYLNLYNYDIGERDVHNNSGQSETKRLINSLSARKKEEFVFSMKTPKNCLENILKK